MKNNAIKKIKHDLKMRPVISYSDEQFVQDCFSSKDFIDFIDENPNGDYKDIFLFEKDNILVGLTILNCYIEGHVNIAAPLLIMTKKKTINTFKAFLVLLEYLFKDCNIFRVEVKVYGNNKEMLDVMNRGIFCYEGSIKRIKKVNGELRDIHYYSLLKEEYDKFVN